MACSMLASICGLRDASASIYNESKWMCVQARYTKQGAKGVGGRGRKGKGWDGVVM